MTVRKEVHIEDDDLIQYALGTLSDAQLFQMTAHISMCGQCRGEVEKIRSSMAAYGATTEMASLPTGAKDRFMARLQKETAQAEAAITSTANSIPKRTRQLFAWMHSPLPFQILSGALAAGMVFFAYDDAMHYHEMRQMIPKVARFEVQMAKLSDLQQFLQGSNVQSVALHPKPVAKAEPEGHALYSSRMGKLVFTASNLPPVPDGKAYELWILPRDGSAPIPAGTFVPGPTGNAAVVYPQIPAGVDAAGFGVTLEKASGATKPTLPILLSGE